MESTSGKMQRLAESLEFANDLDMAPIAIDLEHDEDCPLGYMDDEDIPKMEMQELIPWALQHCTCDPAFGITLYWLVMPDGEPD